MNDKKFSIIVGVVIALSIAMFAGLYMLGKYSYTDTDNPDYNNGIEALKVDDVYQQDEDYDYDNINTENDDYMEMIENEEEGFGNSEYMQEEDMETINDYYNSLNEEELEGNSLR